MTPAPVLLRRFLSGLPAGPLGFVLAALAAVAALLATRVPAARADAVCPLDSLDIAGTHVVTSAPGYATPTVTLYGLPAFDGYDLAAGTMDAYCPGTLAATYVYTADLYDVSGVPAGTQVPVTVEMSVDGWVATMGCGGTGCWGGFEVQVMTPTDSVNFVRGATLFYPELRPVQFSIGASLVLTAGSPTLVRYLLHAYRTPGGSHTEAGEATVRFLGVPAGAVVTSCQHVQDPAVPARAGSWGRLKATYR